MTITLTGLGSGLDYESWITELVAVKQAAIDKVSTQVSDIKTKESTLSTLKSSYSSLLSSIKAITDAQTNISNNVFNQKTATSSSTAVGVAATSTAAIQNIKVSVSQLATSTTAQSATAASAVVTSDTKVSAVAEGKVNPGSFSVYVNNKKYSIDVTIDESMGDVVNALNTSLKDTGVQASMTNGKFTIANTDTTAANYSADSTLVVGSSTDKSSLSDAMALVKNTDGSYSSSKTIWLADSTEALTGKNADGSSASGFASAITAGTFTIGNAQFTIDSSTTLTGLISQINNNKDAGVSAYWDSNAAKIVMTSTDQGATNINVEAGSSNFTDVIGLTSSTWNTAEDGTKTMATTQLATNSQTLGTNAKLTINGTTITSSSNTVTSDISGLTGVTLTLNSETTSTANVAVAADTTALSTAIQSFVTAYNKVISTTDTDTAKDGDLYGETSLNSIRNNLRTLATAKVDSSNVYKTLASIGITTGSIGTSISANTNQLTVDTAALTKALQADPDSVKKLLLGDGTNDGVLTKLSTTLNASLDTSKGYFATRTKSYDSEMSNLNAKISRQNLDLTAYKKQLEAKFSAMDTLISNLRNQASTMDSTLGIKSSSSSSS